MNTNQLPFTSEERKTLANTSIGSTIGIGVILALTAGFSFLFGFDIHFQTQDTAKQLFSALPFLIGIGFSFFLGREVLRTRKDLAKGYKLVLSGVVTRKYTSINQRSRNSSISTSERIRHFIVVNDEKLYVEFDVYNRVAEGQRIVYHLTPHGREVLWVESV